MKRWSYAAAFLALAWSAAEARTLRIGTWNIANLHHEDGVALRPGAQPRDAQDFDRLRAFAASLALDIVALQEIGSPRALARIFPSADYHLVMSRDYQPGAENKAEDERDIYTAIAIRKSAFPAMPPIEHLEALGVIHVTFDSRTRKATNRPTRDGMILSFDLAGRTVKLLNVHLKSFCHTNSLDPVLDTRQNGQLNANRYDCRTLVAQTMILENWIEQQKELGHSVVLLGDLNRQLNRFDSEDRADHFWEMLNDRKPNGLELRKGPPGKNTTCWPKPHALFHEEHIEFVIFDSALDPFVKSNGIAKVGMPHHDDAKYQGDEGEKLSDHCPIVFEMAD
jgi:endonuclease/exonuclease/phosphatase family metal-dependent hydrolase